MQAAAICTMSSKAVGAMSADDVAGWATGAFDDATVRALREEEIDGELLAAYAQKEDHELLKRRLLLLSRHCSPSCAACG